MKGNGCGAELTMILNFYNYIKQIKVCKHNTWLSHSKAWKEVSQNTAHRSRNISMNGNKNIKKALEVSLTILIQSLNLRKKEMRSNDYIKATLD